MTLHSSSFLLPHSATGISPSNAIGPCQSWKCEQVPDCNTVRRRAPTLSSPVPASTVDAALPPIPAQLSGGAGTGLGTSEVTHV